MAERLIVELTRQLTELGITCLFLGGFLLIRVFGWFLVFGRGLEWRRQRLWCTLRLLSFRAALSVAREICISTLSCLADGADLGGAVPSLGWSGLFPTLDVAVFGFAGSFLRWRLCVQSGPNGWSIPTLLVALRPNWWRNYCLAPRVQILFFLMTKRQISIISSFGTYTPFRVVVLYLQISYLIIRFRIWRFKPVLFVKVSTLSALPVKVFHFI